MSEYKLMYRRNLGSFVDLAFRILHPDEKMDDNWHIRLMANLLQLSWEEPEALKRMTFNLPPGYLKTHICSVALPAWILGRDPRKSVLIVSETPDQSLEIMQRCAELMASKAYRQIFPRAKIAHVSRRLELEYKGGIRCSGAGFSLPQRKSDLVVIDNPQSMHNLHRLSPEPFAEIGRTLKDPKKGMIVLATRRLGENDLTSFLYERGQWGVFEFPVVGIREKKWQLPPDDNRVHMRGEPLHPIRENWDDIKQLLFEMGGDSFCWQYLQGLYTPNTTGQRKGKDKDGNPVLIIGTFSPTGVASEDLDAMRAEWLGRLSAL